MSQPVDNETAYGPDQDREPPKIVGATWQDMADRNPDDFDADIEDGIGVSRLAEAQRGQPARGSDAISTTG
jgi:hypothetical protein